MMKKLLFAAVAAIYLLCFVGCSSLSLTGDCTVTFVVDGEVYVTESVKKGESVHKPANPEKHNYIFVYWSETPSGEEYDFANKVKKNVTLYANFILDAANITNELTTYYIRSVFTVYAVSSKSGGFFDHGGKKDGGQGSGVCFYAGRNTYYILTNCHVAHIVEGYTNVTYTVEDYLGNSYTAYLFSKRSVQAISAEYDLACLYFQSTSSYPVLDIASSDPAVGTDVISLGSPKGQTNAGTFGKILSYNKTTVSDTPAYLSNVSFDVAIHDAYIDHGSSGGPILDANYRVIGINFAGGEDIGCAIPAEKVNEFLKEYVYD